MGNRYADVCLLVGPTVLTGGPVITVNGEATAVNLCLVSLPHQPDSWAPHVRLAINSGLVHNVWTLQTQTAKLAVLRDPRPLLRFFAIAASKLRFYANNSSIRLAVRLIFEEKIKD